MSKAEDAVRNFLSGANCAQAVLAAFAPECGLSETALLKIGSSLGGGMGRLREVCGAASGMFVAFGLIRGNADIHDKKAKDAHYASIQKLAARFKEETGSIICRELLELPEHDACAPDSEARTPEYYRKRPCAELVALAARILEAELAETDDPALPV